MRDEKAASAALVYRRSTAGACPAMSSPSGARRGSPDPAERPTEGLRKRRATPATDRERLALWIDTYAQVSGSYDAEQEAQLRRLRQRFAALLTGL